MRATLLITTILMTSLCAVDSELSLRHRESQSVGYNQGYSTLDYSLTCEQAKYEFLFNLRGHLFNDAKSAGNIGFGFRYFLNEDSSRLGINLYYDFRDTSHFFAHQAAGGLEWVSREVDVRINGYLPFGQQRSFHEYTFKGFSGNSVLVKRKLYATLPCVEGEVGTPLAKPFYFAIGTYYLFPQSSHSLRVGDALGAKVRFDVDLGRYLTLGALITHDRLFHTRVQGVLSLHIPLGPWKSKEKLKERPRDLQHLPIVRNEIIPVQSRRDSKIPFFSSKNELVRFVFIDNTAAPLGNGTFERPFSSLKEAEALSQENDVLYVFPGDGTPRRMNEGIVLKEGQLLASSGSPLELETLAIPPQTPGHHPVMTSIHQDKPIIVNPGNTQLNNFIFMNPWEYLRNYDFISPSVESASPTIESPSSYWNSPALSEWVDLGDAPSAQGGGWFNYFWSLAGQ